MSDVIPITYAPTARDRAYRRGFMDGYAAAVARIQEETRSPRVSAARRGVGRSIAQDLIRHFGYVFKGETSDV